MTLPSNDGLIMRVKTGNERLKQEFFAACLADESGENDKYEYHMQRIDKAYVKLERLCLELEVSGYEKCLYEKPLCTNSSYWCYCCPSKIPHWRVEDAGK